jgi:bifunctional UDP-N-acetylglucosamine pyrophosphorylase/glucosamine-1-phosphate N-acetyltransferase
VRHHRATGAVATVLTAVVDRPQGYGRILRQSGRVKRIVEDRDATDDQKKIAEINTSVYCFEAKRLWKALAEVKPDNDQGEYYLTDVRPSPRPTRSRRSESTTASSSPRSRRSSAGASSTGSWSRA